ncbi:ABC transporter permease [Agriterribacter sp.]|uniref:ABC transporter permease n=1 Tax=Agriterribacter sp. TaxID=2821509 RepID=UPI002CFF3FA0|nr:ABC transporter permease [Agriterribacter sp.]HTN08459.1 ABC transporter permease [Agriterribacter sp.]
MLKHKTFSFINILGLSIGIAICFIIMLFVQGELSYDRFNIKADRTYRIAFKASINGGKILEANVMPPVAAALKNDYPEVEEAIRIKEGGRPKVTYKNKTFKEGRLALVDANFFNVFTLPFLKGDSQVALTDPNTIVLTKELADKYFGKEEPLGKLLFVNNNTTLCKVTGVIDNIPVNAHFHFDMFVSLSGIAYATDQSWMSSGFFTYIVLKKGSDYKKLEAKFPAMVEKYMGPQIQQAMGMSLEQFRTRGNQLGFLLQPLTDIHLHSGSNYEFEPGGDMRYIYIFSAIAIFMLLIACINFINLSTAGTSKRAKEVGIRKVMGSARIELVKQFLLESVLITLIALLLSIVWVKLSLPVFNELSGKNLAIGFAINQAAMFLVIVLLVSLLAGIYPAFFLSSFKPIATLKGKMNTGIKSFKLRSGLVVFQFFISVSLITATVVVYQQMKFIREAKLGYNKDQLIVLPNSWALGKNETVFKEQLLNDPRVVNATISGYKPAGPSYSNNALAYPEGKENQVMKTLEYGIDERYIPTLGIEMAAGRNFSPSRLTDSLGMIINETAAKAFGWGSNAIGQSVIRQNSVRGNNVTFTVVGVVKDFHFRSLHEAITPLLMVLNPESGLIIKVKTKDMAGLLATMKQEWAKFGPEEPFTYNFMDELYNKTYAAEQKTGRILNIFAALTILVACMGLFGLATYTAEQRSKEIGIRKVLGASVTQVTGMLSKEFLKLVLIACIIAFPLSYWAMYTWLQDFAYRININWWVFVLAGSAALLIAVFTVSFQAIKAAVANPVKPLRTE